MVFAARGDFTYLQWALGSVIARFIVALWFVRVFYQREIFSPYDYIGHRLGDGAKKLTTLLFFLGSILGQSVRLLVTALVPRTCTGIDLHLCIWIIGGFAVLWTLMGGMTTVIWTDVVQFGVFVLADLVGVGNRSHRIRGSRGVGGVARVADRHKIHGELVGPAAENSRAGCLRLGKIPGNQQKPGDQAGACHLPWPPERTQNLGDMLTYSHN